MGVVKVKAHSRKTKSGKRTAVKAYKRSLSFEMRFKKDNSLYHSGTEATDKTINEFKKRLHKGHALHGDITKPSRFKIKIKIN